MFTVYCCDFLLNNETVICNMACIYKKVKKTTKNNCVLTNLSFDFYGIYYHDKTSSFHSLSSHETEKAPFHVSSVVLFAFVLSVPKSGREVLSAV